MDLTQTLESGVVAISRLTGAWSREVRSQFSPDGFARGSTISAAAERVRLSDVLDRENLVRAFARVVRSNAAPGVDGMAIHELKPYLRHHWAAIESAIRAGNYTPQPLRAVATGSIPVPTVLDRLIQQAIAQALRPKLRKDGITRHELRDLGTSAMRVDHRDLMRHLGRIVDDAPLIDLLRRYVRCRVRSNAIVTVSREGIVPDTPLASLFAGLALERRGGALRLAHSIVGRREPGLVAWASELHAAWFGRRDSGLTDAVSRLHEPRLGAPTVHWISELKAGRLGILSRPPDDDDLAAEVVGWADAGLEVVICLLKPGELKPHELQAARELWTRHRIEFIAFPVRDGRVPSSESAAKQLAERVAALLREGVSIGIHRRGSAGRSRLVTAVILQEIGFSRSEALATLRKACGLPGGAALFDNDIQETWFATYRREIAQPGMFARFLVPESEVSLKLWFDNIRNYFICGALYLPLSREQPWTTTPAWLAFLFGTIIVVLPAINVLQTFALAKRTLSQLNRWIVKRATNLQPGVRQLVRIVTAPLLVGLFIIIALAAVALVLLLLKIVK